MREFKNIKGYEGLYQVSNFGEVRSLDRTVQRENGVSVRRNGKQLKSSLRNGYLSVCLSKEGKVKKFNIHRLVAITFIPNPDNKTQVNHKDGIKINNFEDNLEWVTPSENVIHAYENNLSNGAIGVSNGKSKLNNEEVCEIKELYSKGMSQRDLSIKYDISQTTVSELVNNMTWIDVGEDVKRDDNFTRSVTGYKNVEKVGDKYRGRFGFNKEVYNCGMYDCPKDAFHAVMKKKFEVGFK